MMNNTVGNGRCREGSIRLLPVPIRYDRRMQARGKITGQLDQVFLAVGETAFGRDEGLIGQSGRGTLVLACTFDTNALFDDTIQ